MIPKIIHYCWYGGGEYSPLIKKCIKSWDKHLQGYELKLWDESNTPTHNAFVREAFARKKYAFVADYMRFEALREYGGIYLDTDILVVKSFDHILHDDECFFGLEDETRINGAVIGARKDSEFIKQCLQTYDNLKFDLSMMNDFSIPKIITAAYNSFEDKSNIKIYPTPFFYPLPFADSLGKLPKVDNYIQKDTICIHLWNASWLDELTAFRNASNGYGVKAKLKSLRDKVKKVFKGN